MADINLNIIVLDGDNCPTLSLIDTTDLSIIVNAGTPILADADVIVPVPQDTNVSIEVSKDGYDTYSNSINVGAVDQTIYVSIKETTLDFLTVTQNCHAYTINNASTTESFTFTVTDLDDNVVGNYLDISLGTESFEDLVFSTDGVYLIKLKDDTDTIVREYVIMDICNILSCMTNRIISILCKNCGCSDDCQDFCKEDFEMKRIHLLFFDLMNRINREYRLNSYYTTIDDAKLNQLKTAQDDITKLIEYCANCGDSAINLTTVITNNDSNSGCGCS